MKKQLWLVSLVCLALFSSVQAQHVKLLVMSKTNGYRHKSIAAGKEALQLMANENNWKIDFTEDSLQFSSYDLLKKYDAIVFLLTTGNILGDAEQDAFIEYIHNGGGLLTIHTGTDTEKGWPWYMHLVGAKFKSHPKTQTATFVVVDSTHAATATLPKLWVRYDELYNYADTLAADAKVLITLDESTYTGGTMGAKHPMAWYKNFEGGRVLQTALGHTDESYKEPAMLAHLKGGILWVAGKAKKRKK